MNSSLNHFQPSGELHEEPRLSEFNPLHGKLLLTGWAGSEATCFGHFEHDDQKVYIISLQASSPPQLQFDSERCFMWDAVLTQTSLTWGGKLG